MTEQTGIILLASVLAIMLLTASLWALVQLWMEQGD